MSIRKFLGSLMGATPSTAGKVSKSGSDTVDTSWDDNYQARQDYFEKTIGPFPTDIMKMLNMVGVWPGGGLYVIPAPKLGKDLSVYTTFGFTNPDMPTGVQVSDFDIQSDGERATRAEGSLSIKQAAPKRAGYAGYGYEILMVAESGQDWPLNFIQWAVNAEIGNDAGLLARVEKYDGLTVERIDAGGGYVINVLIAKAEAPLPTGTTLPAGKMEVLVAITITDEEMAWSQTNGRGALLKKLKEAGVRQISDPDRMSALDGFTILKCDL